MAISSDQRKERIKGLFASDIGKIMTGHGVQVALEKLGRVEPVNFDDDMEVNLGKKVEGLILDAYKRETGFRLRRNIRTEMHPTIPWMGCHRDASALDDKKIPFMNVEAKAVGFYNRWQWGNDGTDQIPDYVLWQTVAQMAVSGLKETDIPVCFITATTLKYIVLEQAPPINRFHIDRDYELEEYMMEKVNGVWQYIQEGLTPPPENLQDTKLVYARAEDPAVEATTKIIRAWRSMIENREELKRLQLLDERYKFEIESFMRKSKSLVLKNNGRTIVTWKNDVDGFKFDFKRLEKEQPEIYREYLVNRPGARKFLLKIPKEKT
jgi:predicted phage-related endonuclease